MLQQQKLIGFDSIRGVAALLVFIFHFYGINQLSHVHFLGMNLAPVFQAGHIGLDMFFVLSGFLIYRSIYFHGANMKYLQRRFLRIAPIYYFSLFIFLIFVVPQMMLTRSGLMNIASHLLFLQSMSASTYYGINPVLWSLSVEMIFYAFLPIFFLFTRRNTLLILLGCLLMVSITYWFRVYIADFYPAWNQEQRIIYTENFIGLLDHFAFGILASWATIFIAHKQSMQSATAKLAALLLLLISLGGLGISIHLFATLQQTFRDHYYSQVFLHSLVGLSTASFLFSLAHTFSWVKTAVSNRVLLGVGTISYSFYIWHFIIIQQVTRLSFGVSSKFLIALTLTLGLSAATYFCIEKPFLTRKKY